MKNVQWICYRKGTEPFQNTNDIVPESINIITESEMISGATTMMPIAESESMYIPKPEMPIMIATSTEGFQTNSINSMAESEMMSGATTMMPIAESESMYVPKIEMPVMIAQSPSAETTETTESFKNIYKSTINSSRFSSTNSVKVKPIYMISSKKN